MKLRQRPLASGKIAEIRLERGVSIKVELVPHEDDYRSRISIVLPSPVGRPVRPVYALVGGAKLDEVIAALERARALLEPAD
jgi:hypothetical protein